MRTVGIEMTKYRITVFNSDKDEFVEMSADIETDELAIAFAKELYKQKYMNDQPIRITAVWLEKFSWRKLDYRTIYFHDKLIHGDSLEHN